MFHWLNHREAWVLYMFCVLFSGWVSPFVKTNSRLPSVGNFFQLLFPLCILAPELALHPLHCTIAQVPSGFTSDVLALLSHSQMMRQPLQACCLYWAFIKETIYITPVSSPSSLAFPGKNNKHLPKSTQIACGPAVIQIQSFLAW